MTRQSTKALAESRRRENTRQGETRILTKNTGVREDVENDEVNDHFQHHLSYTSSPDGWNRSPAFPQSQRLGIASASSFLGTNYHSKFTIPGPGMHEVSQSTMELKHVSLTRPSDWSRRWRNCRPLIGSDATASLYGADKLLQEPGPDPGTYASPASTFADAKKMKNYCSSAFASQSSRFPPTKAADHTHYRHTGGHEQRAFNRTLPRKTVAHVSPAPGRSRSAARLPGARPATADGAALLAAAQAAVDAAEAHAASVSFAAQPSYSMSDLEFAAPIRVPEKFLWMPNCEHEVRERHDAARDVESLDHFKPPRTGFRV